MSEWISTAQELPADEQSVMIFAPREDDPVWIGYHDGDVWRLASGDATKVTHWMPMPEPPVTKRKEAES